MENNTVAPFLSGWKDIARYLGKGVRTVQRYERELRLPARRPAGKSRASVVATKQELDAWMSTSPLRNALPLKPASLDFASFKAFKIAVAEHRQLREEMRKMREEFHASLEMFRAQVRFAKPARHEQFLLDHIDTPLTYRKVN